MISRSVLNKGNRFTREKNKVKGLYIEGEGRLGKQTFRCGSSSLTYLPRESVLVCSVSEPGDAGFPVYLACPVTGLTGGLERRFRNCFLLSINEHQIILQCALVYTLWQVGRLETEFSKAEETAAVGEQEGEWWGEELLQGSCWNRIHFEFSHISSKTWESHFAFLYFIFIYLLIYGDNGYLTL